MISEELISAYTATHFCVRDGNIQFVLRVGEPSDELKALFQTTGAHQAAYITAYNPFSKSLTDAANVERHGAVLERLSNRWPVYEGFGQDAQGEWPPERSLLILGITLDDALDIGREFDQNAIVYCEETAIPSLYLCESETRVA